MLKKKQRRFIMFFLLLTFVYIFFIANFSPIIYAKEKIPKYVFLFIGDGFGYAQMSLASLYKTEVLKEPDLMMKSCPVLGNTEIKSESSLITDSSAAASAISAGIKTLNGYLNIDKNGKSYETICEKLKKQSGYKIGIISSVNINHATPAAFYSHITSRYSEGKIFTDLLASGFDYFAGGTVLDKSGAEEITGKTFEEIIADSGYKYLSNDEDINKKYKESDKLIFIPPDTDGNGTLQYGIDKNDDAYSLSDLVTYGINKLYGSDGFFIMAEGGKIDWACHSNDAATMIYEVFEFDKAISKALEFYENHKEETLIIITADHETGGLSLGYSATYTSTYFKFLQNQKLSFTKYSGRVYGFRNNNTPFDEVYKDIVDKFIKNSDGTMPDDLYFTGEEIKILHGAYDMSMLDSSLRDFSMSEYVDYGFYDPLTTTIMKLMDKKAGINWGTFSHSAISVPVLAIGTGSENFMGNYDNTQIFFKLKNIMGVK